MRWQPTEGTVVRLGFNEESNFPSEENALIELDDLSEETDEDYVLGMVAWISMKTTLTLKMMSLAHKWKQAMEIFLDGNFFVNACCD